MVTLSVGRLGLVFYALVSLLSLMAQDSSSSSGAASLLKANPKMTTIDPSKVDAAASAPVVSGATEKKSQVNDTTEAPLAFHDFIQAVQDSNLNYAAQKYSVPIAQAQISLARLWPNPTIQAGYNAPFHQSDSVTGIPPGVITGDQSLPSATTASLSEAIPIGGRLSAKEAVARTATTQAEAQLQDYFRNLRATSAGSYIDALTAELVVERKQQTYQSLKALSDLNEIRFKDGDIAEADLIEARLAALEALSDLHSSESTLRQATLGLAVLVGRKELLRVYHPIGNLALRERTFDLETLVNTAILTRSDVVAALHAKENADAQFSLAKANRIPDITASVNYTHNSQSQNTFAPSPENDQIGFSLQVPIPVSNFDTDDLKAARLTVLQADKQLEAAQVQAETDVRQAVARYRSALDSVRQYSGGILSDAQRALDIKLYSYKKGSSTLLDVRQAESDLNDTYQSYYSALNEEAKALVNVEQAAGVWDIEL
jgi:cobalt-zinc-cadmium efflux system outer membrane protein